MLIFNKKWHLRWCHYCVSGNAVMSRNAKLSCAQAVASKHGKQPRSMCCGLRDLGCHAASCLPQTNPVWMNWNSDSSMSGAVLNSRLLTRLLTSGEECIECVSMLKKDISSTACELTMLILSISVTFNVTCLTVTSLITKSLLQRWPIHSCSFYKVMH